MLTENKVTYTKKGMIEAGLVKSKYTWFQFVSVYDLLNIFRDTSL